jgi:hypothetical protein
MIRTVLCLAFWPHQRARNSAEVLVNFRVIAW